MNRQSILSRGGGVIISMAVILAIAAVALAALFNPVWIGPAQERSGVPSITGWSTAEVERITGSILQDVLLGPPAFAMSGPGGQAVLDEAERGHMRDVYAVLRAFALVVLLAGGVGALLLWRHRSEAAAWRAVARGAAILAIAGVVMAVLVAFFFDAAFLAFHLVFFPQGNFSFDPATERLTQLFPGQFWTESAAAVVMVGLVLSLATWFLARRRARTFSS
ncbi:MAG TPA: DUF1461 domain-containing protein [Propionicimonas sp.]